MKLKKSYLLQVIRYCVVISILGFGLSIYLYYTSLASYEAARSTYSNISDQYINNEHESEIHIDFDGLSMINDDIVGWIRSIDNVIDYAIVQGSDNEHYLTHMFDKSYNKAGAIFMDFSNDPDFNDENTIIYGHNMKDGSMFAYLLNYKDQTFYDQHPIMNLYTINAVYRIDIFAGIIISGDENHLLTSFINEAEKTSYINDLKEKSTFVSEVAIAQNARLITLSTCSYDFEDARYVLFGVINSVQ